MVVDSPAFGVVSSAVAVLVDCLFVAETFRTEAG